MVFTACFALCLASCSMTHWMLLATASARLTTFTGNSENAKFSDYSKALSLLGGNEAVGSVMSPLSSSASFCSQIPDGPRLCSDHSAFGQRRSEDLGALPQGTEVRPRCCDSWTLSSEGLPSARASASQGGCQGWAMGTSPVPASRLTSAVTCALILQGGDP